jgi:DNA uptake protein ComE-like DNA-binding protein
MLKLILPFFTISIFIGKSEPRKLNPNIATFEELLSIPIITEEEALAIIAARTVKEFESITDLIERTGLDTYKSGGPSRSLYF